MSFLFVCFLFAKNEIIFAQSKRHAPNTFGSHVSPYTNWSCGVFFPGSMILPYFRLLAKQSFERKCISLTQWSKNSFTNMVLIVCLKQQQPSSWPHHPLSQCASKAAEEWPPKSLAWVRVVKSWPVGGMQYPSGTASVGSPWGASWTRHVAQFAPTASKEVERRKYSITVS